MYLYIHFKTWVAASEPLTSAAATEASSSLLRLFSEVVWGKRKETTFHFDAHRHQMDSFLLLLKAVVVRKRRNEESCCTHPKKGKKKKVMAVVRDQRRFFWEKGRRIMAFFVLQKRIFPRRSSHDISKCSVWVYTSSKRAVNHIILLILYSARDQRVIWYIFIMHKY